MKVMLIVAFLATSIASGLAAISTSQTAVFTFLPEDTKSTYYLKGTRSPHYDYNCQGHQDGNYPHPDKCTHYIACVNQQHAYEMVCATNHDGNPLHYVQDSGPNPQTSKCDYPEVVGCTRPPVDPERPCNPLECWNDGWCNNYETCDSGQSHSGTCEDNLWWNPNRGVVEGHLKGQCDKWENLDEATQNGYLNDPNCIPPCEWKSNGGPCTAEYTFRAPFVDNIHGRETNLTCNDGLVWSNDDHNCVHCSSKTNENNESCCGAARRR